MLPLLRSVGVCRSSVLRYVFCVPELYVNQFFCMETFFFWLLDLYEVLKLLALFFSLCAFILYRWYTVKGSCIRIYDISQSK